MRKRKKKPRLNKVLNMQMTSSLKLLT